MLDDLEAVRAVCDILRPFDEDDRARVLRWTKERIKEMPVEESLGAEPAEAPASEPADPPAEVEQPPPEKHTPSETAPPTPAPKPPPAPKPRKSKRRRYSDETKEAVLADIRGGMTAYAAGKKHDVSTGAVYRWANQAGLVNNQDESTDKSTPDVNNDRRAAIAEAAKRNPPPKPRPRPPVRLRQEPPTDPRARREQILQAIAAQVPPKHVMETYGLSRDDYDRIREQWLRDHE